MKTQIQKPKQESRTIQSKTKAANQAPLGQILQRYKDKTIQREVFPDEDELLQGKFETIQKEKFEDEDLLQGKFDKTAQLMDFDEEEPLQQKSISTSSVQRKESPNRTGLPDNLKSGIENMSGYSMDDVRVHYNSSKPAQLQALAYTQGTDIHVAPGQEKHLPHEAWHVVQQKQGRVQPTMQLHGVNVNDNEGLEKEADVMGGGSIKLQTKIHRNINQSLQLPQNFVCQFTLSEKAAEVMKIVKEHETFSKEKKEEYDYDNWRKDLMAWLEEDFRYEYMNFINTERGTIEPKQNEVEMALREYVKALTSSLYSAEGWEDVAILHKRVSTPKTDVDKDVDKHKYAAITHHTLDEWGLGSHSELEQRGQIYGPATEGLGVKNGIHTWGSNAAWLLGHMHSGHRFIQIVPHTEDNLMRGSTKDEELGALAQENLVLIHAGYDKKRQDDEYKLWTEYTPTKKTLKTSLNELARRELKPAHVQQLFKWRGLFTDDIKLDDVIALDQHYSEYKRFYEYGKNIYTGNKPSKKKE